MADIALVQTGTWKIEPEILDFKLAIPVSSPKLYTSRKKKGDICHRLSVTLESC